MLKEAFDELLVKLVPAVQARYGDRLVTIAVYGSVARGTMRHDSDVDLLIIATDLPNGRMKRRQEFDAVEEDLAEALRDLQSRGVASSLSAVLKTPEEANAGTPLYLDMVEDARLLYDRSLNLNLLTAAFGDQRPD